MMMVRGLVPTFSRQRNGTNNGIAKSKEKKKKSRKSHIHLLGSSEEKPLASFAQDRLLIVYALSGLDSRGLPTKEPPPASGDDDLFSRVSKVDER